MNIRFYQACGKVRICYICISGKRIVETSEQH